jgi:hypothetical protein
MPTTTKTRRKWLIDAVRTYVVPAIMAHGFQSAPARPSPPPVDREYRVSFPDWGRFVRDRDSVVDILEVQFASYGRAAFRVSAGTMPKTGLTTWAGHRAPDETGVHYLEEWYESDARPWLKSGRWTFYLPPLGSWYSVWPRPWRAITEEDYAHLARSAGGQIGDIDIALRNKQVGRNLRRVSLPWSRRPRPRSNEVQ